MSRTDIHRPSAIIPADYEHVLSYSLPTTVGGYPIPSIGINCELDGREVSRGADGVETIVNGAHASDGRCCIIGLLYVAKVPFVETGAGGKCSVCGAGFIYGDVWKHVPTGEHLHLGHDCADKYSMIADRSAWAKENGRVRESLASEILKAKKAEERAEFFSNFPGLREALDLAEKHVILFDLRGKLLSYGSLSEKQVALALKIADEVRNPKPEEKHVAAPEGRLTFRGRLVSIKVRDSQFGEQVKATIKVETPEGSWLAWGTFPSNLARLNADKGDVVEMVATLKRGRDAHFALYSRPTGGSIIEKASKGAVA